MLIHIVRSIAVAAALVAATFYPFLPGPYDRAAHTISITAQVLTIGSLLLVPVGLLWLVRAWRSRTTSASDGQARAGRRRLETLTAIVTMLVAGLAGVGAVSSGTAALGAAIIVLGGVTGWRMRRRLERSSPAAVATHLIVVPLAALGLTAVMSGWAMTSSRLRAMAHAAQVLADIEQHHAREGSHPVSLVALNHDYETGVVGIERYAYVRHGRAFSLSFQQPELLFPNVGTREVVVYNPAGEHLHASHAAWFAVRPYESLIAQQGWYAGFDAELPNWRYLWFD
ncbi:MAG TPA: hypothetical protein VF198_01015 [Vicinamibacterales bacterium]